MHILIIEDDLLLGLDLQDIVSDLGAQTMALAATEDNAVGSALRHRPNLIVSDVRLAEGTGTAAVRRIRETIGNVPVIYVTANPEKAHQDDPGSVVLTKPVFPDDLARAIAQVMPASHLPAGSNM